MANPPWPVNELLCLIAPFQVAAFCCEAVQYPTAGRPRRVCFQISKTQTFFFPTGEFNSDLVIMNMISPQKAINHCTRFSAYSRTGLGTALVYHTVRIKRISFMIISGSSLNSSSQTAFKATGNGEPGGSLARQPPRTVCSDVTVSSFC